MASAAALNKWADSDCTLPASRCLLRRSWARRRGRRGRRRSRRGGYSAQGSGGCLLAEGSGGAPSERGFTAKAAPPPGLSLSWTAPGLKPTVLLAACENPGVCTTWCLVWPRSLVRPYRGRVQYAPCSAAGRRSDSPGQRRRYSATNTPRPGRPTSTPCPRSFATAR